MIIRKVNPWHVYWFQHFPRKSWNFKFFSSENINIKSTWRKAPFFVSIQISFSVLVMMKDDILKKEKNAIFLLASNCWQNTHRILLGKNMRVLFFLDREKVCLFYACVNACKNDENQLIFWLKCWWLANLNWFRCREKYEYFLYVLGSKYSTNRIQNAIIMSHDT